MSLIGLTKNVDEAQFDPPLDALEEFKLKLKASLDRELETKQGRSADILLRSSSKKGQLDRANPFARQMDNNWSEYAERLNKRLIEAKTALIDREDELDALRRHHDELAQAFFDTLESIDCDDNSLELRADLREARKRLKAAQAEFDLRTRKKSEINEKLSEQVIEIHGDKPSLSIEGAKFLELKKEALRDSSKEYAYLKHRLEAFIELVGDFPINRYNLNHLSEFADKLRYVPANYKVKPKWRKLSLADASRLNKSAGSCRDACLSYKTIKTNYIGKIKTIFSYVCAVNGIRSPFEASNPIIAASNVQSVIRKPLSIENIGRLFKESVQAERPDDALLPLLGALTGARLGELVFLQRSDIKPFCKRSDSSAFSDSHYIADLIRPVIEADGTVTRRPTKNENSVRYIALHDVLTDIGFIEWALARQGFLFPHLHQKGIVRPTDTASKRLQHLFKEAGVHEARTEVFHSLRHFYKDWARDAGVAERTLDLQTGHALLSVGRQYGSRVLRPNEVKALARMGLPEGFSQAYGDFDFSRFSGKYHFAKPRRRPVRASEEGRPATEDPVSPA